MVLSSLISRTSIVYCSINSLFTVVLLYLRCSCDVEPLAILIRRKGEKGYGCARRRTLVPVERRSD